MVVTVWGSDAFCIYLQADIVGLTLFNLPYGSVFVPPTSADTLLAHIILCICLYLALALYMCSACSGTLCMVMVECSHTYVVVVMVVVLSLIAEGVVDVACTCYCAIGTCFHTLPRVCVRVVCVWVCVCVCVYIYIYICCSNVAAAKACILCKH